MKLRQKNSLSELPICKCAGANDKEEASPEVDRPMHYIKSKRRVADHGEVFTPEWLVEAMLDLVKDETERIDSRFLEPACGSGNFLVRILQRKLAAVELKYGKSEFERRHYALLALMWASGLAAGGIRSFVALPLEPGGRVVRSQLTYSTNPDVTILTTNLAWGLTPRQALLFAMPYMSVEGHDDLGDLSAIYRHTVLQHDFREGTRRVAVLGGLRIPTDSERDIRPQLGAVLTLYRGRAEWDIDLLWTQGTGDSPDMGRYDVSWQYRLAPKQYPEWGIPAEWDFVAELGGRYIEGSETVHQATLGALWVHRRWVLETAVVRDLNGLKDTAGLIGIRAHF